MGNAAEHSRQLREHQPRQGEAKAPRVYDENMLESREFDALASKEIKSIDPYKEASVCDSLETDDSSLETDGDSLETDDDTLICDQLEADTELFSYEGHRGGGHTTTVAVSNSRKSPVVQRSISNASSIRQRLPRAADSPQSLPKTPQNEGHMNINNANGRNIWWTCLVWYQNCQYLVRAIIILTIVAVALIVLGLFYEIWRVYLGGAPWNSDLDAATIASPAMGFWAMAITTLSPLSGPMRIVCRVPVLDSISICKPNAPLQQPYEEPELSASDRMGISLQSLFSTRRGYELYEALSHRQFALVRVKTVAELSSMPHVDEVLTMVYRLQNEFPQAPVEFYDLCLRAGYLVNDLQHDAKDLVEDLYEVAAEAKDEVHWWELPWPWSKLDTQDRLLREYKISSGYWKEFLRNTRPQINRFLQHSDPIKTKLLNIKAGTVVLNKCADKARRELKADIKDRRKQFMGRFRHRDELYRLWYNLAHHVRELDNYYDETIVIVTEAYQMIEHLEDFFKHIRDNMSGPFDNLLPQTKKEVIPTTNESITAARGLYGIVNGLHKARSTEWQALFSQCSKEEEKFGQ